MSKIILSVFSLCIAANAYAQNDDFCQQLSDAVLKIYPQGMIITDVTFKYTATDSSFLKMPVYFLTEFEYLNGKLRLKNCSQNSDDKAVYNIERIYPNLNSNPKFKINFRFQIKKWNIENIESNNAVELISNALCDAYRNREKSVFPSKFYIDLKKQTIEEEYPAHILALKNIFNTML